MFQSLKSKCLWTALIVMMTASVFAQPGQPGQSADQLARLLQNPLANIAAIMTDNDVLFGTGTNKKTAYSFQLQPVYAFDFPNKGFTVIPRAVIPVISAVPDSDLSKLGSVDSTGSGRVFGVGDIVTQLFITPHTKSAWKWGIGPQLSWKARTDNKLGGPGWGAGVVGIVTGNITEQLSFAGIVGNLWSYNNDFSTTSLQPMLFYNFKSMPGVYGGYNANITADWKAKSHDRWTVPVGAVVGKTFNLGQGYGLDLHAGPYWNVVRPDGAASWSIKLGVSLIIPKS